MGAIALQADGTILIGGAFTSVGATTVRHLARLLPDGSVDPSFTTRVDGAVQVIKVQPDGRVLIGGSFSRVDGQPWGALARLDATGRLDTTFAPAVTGGSVGSIVVRPDDKVVVGGNFTTVSGIARSMLARLAPDGSLDESFVPELGSVYGVTALALASDGALVVSGASTFRLFSQPLLLRLTETGARGSGFSVSLQLNDPPPSVLQPGADGTLLAAGYGYFSSLMRIGADGTVLSAGKYGRLNGSGGISAIAQHADGRLSLGGVFDNLFQGPTPHRNVARTDLKGGVDFFYRVNANDTVVALAVQADGALLIGGFFTEVNGVPRLHLARVLDEPAASTSLVVIDGARARWTLPPTAPPLTDAELQWSADGQRFVRLRTLERTASGWEGLIGALPDGARWIRAAGQDTSGTSMIGSPALEWTRHRPSVGDTPSPYLSTAQGALTLPVFVFEPTAFWTVSSDAPWLTAQASAAAGFGTVTLTATSSNPGTTPRHATVSIAGRWFRVTQEAGTQTFTAEVGDFRQYFAEGVVSESADLQRYRIASFFWTEFALLNPTDTPATAVLQFQKPDGTVVAHSVDVAGRSRATVFPRHFLDLLKCSIVGVGLMTCNGEFSTLVESAVPLVVDRTVSWDESRYGAHAETGTDAPERTWYLAEGATHSGFDLFYLLQNPNDTAATVAVEYMRPAPLPPVIRSYGVRPRSRFNIWVNRDPALSATDVSARITADVPIIVERAMYRGDGRMFEAGHGAAAVAAPQTRWFFAEGATGAYFDLFLLVANPGAVTAAVKATYLLPSGETVVKTYDVAPRSRFNIWVDHEDARLADTAVSTVIESTNDVPIVAERSMWWPGNVVGGWHEAHASAGATETGTLWALAAGRVSDAPKHETYVLVANTSATIADVAVTLVFEDGTSAMRTYNVAPSSRFNVAIASEFPEAAGRRFGTLVESRGETPAQLVVERAMYSDAGTLGWAAGTNALGRRLR